MKLNKITLWSLISGLLFTLVGCNNATSDNVNRYYKLNTGSAWMSATQYWV